MEISVKGDKIAGNLALKLFPFSTFKIKNFKDAKGIQNIPLIYLFIIVHH